MVQPRKQPKQARAKQRVATLLEVAENLLIEEGFDQFSTNKVAQRAGVNIASLYQYFPNKDALIYAINRKMLDDVLELCQQHREEWSELNWQQSIEQLEASFATDQHHIKLVRALDNAIFNSPALLAMEHEHGEVIANYYADFLQHYGSQWPKRSLVNAGRYIYGISNVTYYDLGHISPADEKESMKLYLMNLYDFINRVLTDEKPPV